MNNETVRATAVVKGRLIRTCFMACVKIRRLDVAQAEMLKVEMSRN